MPEQTIPQTITTETSKKGSINLPEFLRSLATTAYVAGATILLQFLDAAITALTTTGSFSFDWTNLLITVKIALATLIGDSVRRIVKDSVTVIRVKPGLPEIKTNDEGAGGSGEIPSKPPPVGP